ncbi:MAG: RimK family alpha-L-glutamate ligase [Promethearchaeota archaeon]
MSSKLNRIYVGAICNRDLEIFREIKNFCSKNYNISIINLLKKGSKSFNAKYLKKKLKKYPISLFIVKLYSEKANQNIYNILRKVAPNIPWLNSFESVSLCESRLDTFKLIEQKYNKLQIPKTYSSLDDAFNACANGAVIIVKHDTHNISNFPKSERIIGIANSTEELKELVSDNQNNSLFFQKYLGEFDVIYKVYVIDRWIVSITSHDRLQENQNLSPLDLIHIRVPIEKKLKRRILRLGRRMGMAIFGVDYILTNDKTPYIIDVNDFPSFRSIPEAVSLISDYIYNLTIMQQVRVKTPITV